MYISMEVIMPKIKGVTGVDSTYNTGSVRKNQEEENGFSSYLEQGKSLEDIFKQASQRYGVPLELLKAVGKAESDFDPNAVSRAGAQGVMQLMPGTAKEIGVTDAFDPEQNIMGGAKYLAGLLKKYDGDTRLALAAYNAGSGNVRKYGGIPPFKETQNYVKKVMKYMGEQITISSTWDGSNKAPTANTVPFVAAPVQKNLAFLLTNDTPGTSDNLNDLQTLFSYEDYMKFLELLLRDEKEENEEENENEKNNAYATNEINYNVPVLNLIREQDS